MLLRPCPFCSKSIPRAMTVCPYCHRDEQGKSVQIDTAAPPPESDTRGLEQDLKDLASDDPYERDQAIVRMAHRGHGVVQGLIDVLSDLGKPGIAGVAKTLGRIGDRRALKALTQAARMGDEEVRRAAVWALAQFHEEEIFPVLLSEAERPDPTAQAFLAYVLGTFRDARAVPILGRLLKHPSQEVAFHAACALGETGDAAAIVPLRRGLSRRNEVVRTAVNASLRRLGASLSLAPSFSVMAWLSVGVLALSAAVFWVVQR